MKGVSLNQLLPKELVEHYIETPARERCKETRKNLLNFYQENLQLTEEEKSRFQLSI